MALVLPTSLKRLAIFALCWGMLQPMAGRLFPRAEDVLKQEGMDPALVETLAPGKKIYVRQGESLLARAHAALDVSATFAPYHYWSQMSGDSKNVAYTLGDEPQSIFRVAMLLVPETERPCIIYMKPKDQFKDAAYVRRRIEQKAGRALDWKEPLELQQADNYRLTLLHEIRHCSHVNQHLEDGYEQESDATWEGLKALAESRRQPALIDIYQREMGGGGAGGAYDVALYIDAKRKGAAPPTEADIEKIGAVIEPLEMGLIRKKIAEAKGLCAPTRRDINCLYTPPSFSDPLTKRRYQLLDQFASHTLDVAPKKAPPRKPGGRKPQA